MLFAADGGGAAFIGFSMFNRDYDMGTDSFYHPGDTSVPGYPCSNLGVLVPCPVVANGATFQVPYDIDLNAIEGTLSVTFTNNLSAPEPNSGGLLLAVAVLEGLRRLRRNTSAG